MNLREKKRLANANGTGQFEYKYRKGTAPFNKRARNRKANKVARKSRKANRV